jgi:DNA-binding SARP family transcriptional activator/tetratricopeptide (TPR) repeat protein/DNA polymerase III delta prime subunit
MAQNDALKLRFLGEIAIERGERSLELPQSRKTRALLAYLVLNRRPQRRDRLCSLFWDVADDPRGALRWSLSRLRPLVDGSKRQRLVTDREHVSFDCDGVWVDVLAVRDQAKALASNASTKALKAMAELFRGEFLEGLELPDFDEFQAWCIAEREQSRRLRVELLTEIVERLSADRGAALPYAKALVQTDPLNETAHASLVGLLLAEGRGKEARQQYETGLRLLKEAGVASPAKLNQAWRTPRSAESAVTEPVLLPEPVPAEPRGALPIVGRRTELTTLDHAVQNTRQIRGARVLLFSGEPGIGKTRLLSEAMAIARQNGATVLEGSAFEAEASRPYGPWIDALRKLSPITVGATIGADLASLVPELSPGSASPKTRDQMFGAVVELIAARAHSSGLVVLVLDDMQWCDDASAELLHYAIRSNRHRPLLVLLAARAGEMPDNTSMVRVLRSLRRDNIVEQITIDRLSEKDTLELARQIDPRLEHLRGLADTSGNPLFVLELARSGADRPADAFSQNLVDLVRDRVERLRPPAPEVLRWGAVLGSTFTAGAIAELCGVDPDALMRALEVLERHDLIHETTAKDSAGASYRFMHDLVRNIVYTDISEPRRRIMHGRVASFLSALQEHNESITPDVVQHAALANDAALAARACVAAGRRCLRLFANLQAETFAKRGVLFSNQLLEPEQVKLLIELEQVAVAARRPAELEAEAGRIEQLAERALDYGCMSHARLAFHISSYLRWEGGDWSVAERDTLRAELISRTADGRERLVALAEAARCLTMLERDLGRASSLLLEASQLSERIGVEAVAVPMAEGMIHEHEGRYPHAIRLFCHALELARRDRDRENEFRALEHLVMVRIDQEEYAEAALSADELIVIGGKLREGSEAPFARVLRLLGGYALGSVDDSALEQALAELRAFDAKHRLAFALTRAAAVDLKRGRLDPAERRGAEALRMAEILKRPSEVALARSILGQVMLARKRSDETREHAEAIAGLDSRSLSSQAQAAVSAFTAKKHLRNDGASNGNRGRRKVVRATP